MTATAAVVGHAAASHVGLRRTTNQDAALARPPIFAVADGVGRSQGGGDAARVAVETLARATPRRLVAAVEAAHERVLADHAGAATTVTAAAVDGPRVLLAHVGDSRAYRLRDGVLEQLTEDDALVAELVRSGALPPDRAAGHPRRSAITRAVGTPENFGVSCREEDARPGDTWLLCSDGLSSALADEEIAAVLGGEPDLERAAERLVAAANDHGGRDNVTVVLFRLGA